MTGLTITAPGSLLQFCKVMEAQAAALNRQLEPIKQAASQLDRAARFIAEQYAKSPLAKKRAAKVNLTAAVCAALARARKTLRQIFAEIEEKKTAAQLFTSSPPALAQHFAANAPNERATHRLNTGSTRALALKRKTR